MSGEVIKEGFLKKKGRINPAMQERKVVLSGYTLKYYDFKKLKGEIDVRDAEVSVLNEQEFLFQIRATDRIYELQASTRKDLFEWVETLNRYIPTLPSTGRTAKESKREKLRSMFSSSGSRVDSQRNTSRFSTARNRSPERRSQRSTGRGAQSERQPSPPPSPANTDLQEKEEENPPSISDRSSQKSPRRVDSSSSSSAASSSPPTISESNGTTPTNRPPSSSSSQQPSPSSLTSTSPPSSSTPSSKVEEPSPAARKSDPSPAARKVDPSPRRSVRRDPSNISMSTSTSPPNSSSNSSPSNPSPVSSLSRQASAILSSSKEKEPTLNEKDDYIKKGKLKKKGEVNPIFKERTFVLRHNGQLEYYDEKLILKGSISLVDRSYLVTSVASFEWKLLPPGSEEKGREYVLRALSQDDMKEWLRALQISMEELALMKRKSIAGLNSLALPSSKAPGTAVLKEGIMFKKGESSATLWRERKFQLFADSIVYADLSGKLRGKIELTGYHRVVVMSQENCEFEIVPRDPKERHYSLRSKSKYDMDGWIAKINNVIEDLRAPPPEESKKNEDTDEDISDNEMEFEEATTTSSRKRRSGSPPPSSSSKPSSSDSSQQASSPSNQPKKDNNNEGGAKKEAPAKKETFALNELDEPAAPSFDLNELDPDLASQADKPRPKTWVPDKRYKDCMICHVEFTFFNRKHHCRNCGKLLCDDCTPNFIRLPELGYVEPVRVCIACTDQHFKHAPKEQAGGGCLIS